MRENEEGHHEMADLLFQREVIYTEDVEKILGNKSDATPSEGKTTPPPPPSSTKTEEEDSCSEQVHDSGILGADSCGD